ncbi:MAG: PAS domain-containing protein [Ramlibacter sp.]
MRRLRDAWAVVATALLTGALLAYAVLYLRESTLRSGRDVTDSLSLVIAEQTERTLESVDQNLQLAAQELAGLRRAGTLDAQAGTQVLRKAVEHQRFVRAVWVLDLQGRVLMSSEPEMAGGSASDLSYFQAWQRDAAPDVHVGSGYRDAAGEWQMPLLRAVREKGRVTQVMVAAIAPQYFEQLWRGVDLGRSGTVVLYHRSGRFQMRTPPEPALVGQDLSHLPLFSEHLARAPSGVYFGPSPLNGRQRVVAYRQLPKYPELIVLVASGFDELLASWRGFALLTGGVWAAAVAVALALTLRLRRQARHSAWTERRFTELAQAMPQVVFTANERGQLQFASQRWTEVTGAPPEAALGSGWQEWLHPAERAGVVERLRQMLAAGQELQVEHRLRYRDGSYRWQLLRAVPVRQEDGRLLWYGTATDIDALKEARDRLGEQADRLRMAGRLTRMGSWRADMRTQRVALSEEAAAILDLPPDTEPTVQELFAMFAPDSVANGMAALARCVEQGEPFDVEVEMVTAAGRRVWIRSLGQPIRDEPDGPVTAIDGAQQDITLRVLMMEEIRRLNASLEERIAERTAQLARQEALFRTLAEQAPLPFWTVDPHGGVTFASRAWYELAGGAPPQWHGHEWMKIVHPDDIDRVRANWVRSMVTGQPFVGTRRIRGQDGLYHTTRYRAEPVRGDAGEVLFWVGVDSDITDMKANEDALRLANEQLEAFSYSVSHDLQSPLQRIASFGRLLQQELQGAPRGKAQHFLDRILANADTMAQLIEGLLALAQVSQVQLIRAPVNLSEMASEILMRLQAEQPQRSVRWRVAPGLTVLGDLRLMRSVLENLLGNAWKFTAQREDAQIEVGASAERGEYFVRDNGVGFDMAYADRLFGTFQRLHADDEFPGTGIGLATVARAISRQGGRIWARAAPGEGATFFFTLPPA